MNKRITSLLFSSILLATPMSIQAQYHSQVWNPDNGNGTYTNPVIYADYSDPDVVAVGEDYYLTASFFVLLRAIEGSATYFCCGCLIISGIQ